MKILIVSVCSVAVILALAPAAAFCGEKPPKPEEKPEMEDPSLTGEEVKEASGLENTLATTYAKRQSTHFFLETSYPMESAKDYIKFCEVQYADFLKWADLPKDHNLWGQRAHIVVIGNKGEWEALLRHQYRSLPPKEQELRMKIGGFWDSHPPVTFNLSHEGATPEADKLHILHSLTHLFLHGLTGSGGDGFIPWLYEAFSRHRELELFGGLGGGCIAFETQAERGKDNSWNDPDDWVKLLKKQVMQKDDEEFVMFWHKNLMDVSIPTYVKSWSIIQFLVRDDAAKGDFLRFLKMLKTKNDQAKALKMVYNFAPDDLEREWRAWIKKQKSKKLTRREKKPSESGGGDD